MPRTQRSRPLTLRKPRPGVVRVADDLGREPPRVMVLWCPDWPVLAAIHDARARPRTPRSRSSRRTSCTPRPPRRGRRTSCAGCGCARRRPGIPKLVDLPYDPAVDLRVFEPVIAAIEELTPGVQVLRPGLCAVRSRGAARYYGSEKAAGLAIAGRMAELGAVGTRVGIADGIFAAEQAARTDRMACSRSRRAARRSSSPRCRCRCWASPALVMLLRRLGIHTLGDFAALSADDVLVRFGTSGARLHALAGGRDGIEHAARTPPPDLDAVVDFEPALDRVDQVAFGVRTTAEALIDGLTARKLVATAIRVELHTDSGGLSERVWLHPRSFTPDGRRRPGALAAAGRRYGCRAHVRRRASADRAGERRRDRQPRDRAVGHRAGRAGAPRALPGAEHARPRRRAHREHRRRPDARRPAAAGGVGRPAGAAARCRRSRGRGACPLPCRARCSRLGVRCT